MRNHENDNDILSPFCSGGELFRRRREIHDAANVWLWHRDVGPYLGRDDSIIYDHDEVYVVDHEGLIDRFGNVEDTFPSPIQRIGEGCRINRGVVVAQMRYCEHVIPTHRLLSTTGCFVLGMIKVQRRFRYKRVLRMLGTYQIFPSSLQHHMPLRELVARFLCGPPVQYKPRPQCLFRDEEDYWYNRDTPFPQKPCIGWRMLYRQ
jgi:hypothetical protein